MIVISTINITDLDNHEVIILPGTDILYHRYEDDRIEIVFRHSTDRFTCSDFDIENYLANTERNIVYTQYGKSGTEWFFEQQKDRTYGEGQEDNTAKYDVKVTDKTNQELKEATLTVIKYLKSIDCTNLEQTIVSFLGREEKRLEKEYGRLDILTASDEDIIQNALLYYANDYLAHYGTETADKIRDVRERYLENKGEIEI